MVALREELFCDDSFDCVFLRRDGVPLFFLFLDTAVVDDVDVALLPRDFSFLVNI